MRGGARVGAGRPSLSPNKVSFDQTQRLSVLAKSCAGEAVDTLVDVARHGLTDAARVSAAKALLDCGNGKPAIRGDTSAVDLLPV